MPIFAFSRATSVSCLRLSFARGPRSAKSHSSRGSPPWSPPGFVRADQASRGAAVVAGETVAPRALGVRCSRASAVAVVGATRVGAPWMNDGAPDEEALRRVWPRSPIERARGRRARTGRGGGLPRVRTETRGVKEGGGGEADASG